MESRLPKPSGLKRPMSAIKQTLPTDRNKALMNNMNANTTYSGPTAQPLTRDLQNIPQASLMRQGGKLINYPLQLGINSANKNIARALSPEPRKPMSMQNRSKLRRSRSACDISEIRQNLKRIGAPNLSTIPSKLTRHANSTMTANTATGSESTTGMCRTARAGSAPARRLNVAATAPAATTRPLPRTAASTNKAKPPTGTAGGGAATAAPKRIAPYDFKARFHDLLEKHKVLKSKYEKQVDDMGELESLPTQLEESQTKLIQTESMLKHTQTEKECLQRQLKQQVDRIETITSTLGRTKDELDQLKVAHQVSR